MNEELLELVLPRLARRLHKKLEQLQSGEIDQDGFARGFETLLHRQYAWLARRGVPEDEAAVAIHAAVLILSEPGLRAEAESEGVPLEVVETRAVRDAADEVASTYGIGRTRAFRQIAALLARYGD